MVVLISYEETGGDVRRGACDAKCYNAMGSDCYCPCRGGNHGMGLAGAIANTRELAASQPDADLVFLHPEPEPEPEAEAEAG